MMVRLRPWLLSLGLAAWLPVSTGVASSSDAAALAHRVETKAAELARAHVSAPDRFEVLASRFGGADRSAGAIRLEPLDIVGPNAAGMMRVSLRMLDADNGSPRGVARASVRGRVMGPALQATRTLPRDRVIRPADVELRESDLTRLTDEPLREAASAVGRVPLRSLGTGRVLSSKLLGTAPAVRRGETADLRYQSVAFHVVVSVIALRDGAPGDVIPVENPASGVVLQGLVRSDGTLLAPR